MAKWLGFVCVVMCLVGCHQSRAAKAERTLAEHGITKSTIAKSVERKEGIGVVRVVRASREVFYQWPLPSREGYRYVLELTASVKPGRYGLLGENHRDPFEVVASLEALVLSPGRTYLAILATPPFGGGVGLHGAVPTEGAGAPEVDVIRRWIEELRSR